MTTENTPTSHVTMNVHHAETLDIRSSLHDKEESEYSPWLSFALGGMSFFVNDPQWLHTLANEAHQAWLQLSFAQGRDLPTTTWTGFVAQGQPTQ